MKKTILTNLHDPKLLDEMTKSKNFLSGSFLDNMDSDNLIEFISIIMGTLTKKQRKIIIKELYKNYRRAFELAAITDGLLDEDWQYIEE